MKNFEKLLEYQREHELYNLWFQQSPPEYYLKTMPEEINEALRELEVGDYEAFEDEMGDVLWMTVNALRKAESLGYINIERLIDRTLTKLDERMPYVQAGKPVESMEKLVELWNEAKKRQKERKRV